MSHRDMLVPFLARGEKRVLIAALVAACFAGSVAACVAYMDAAEAQFHGGVLEEDAADARFTRFRESASAFALWGSGTLLVLLVAAMAVRSLGAPDEP